MSEDKMTGNPWKIGSNDACSKCGIVDETVDLWRVNGINAPKMCAWCINYYARPVEAPKIVPFGRAK